MWLLAEETLLAMQHAARAGLMPSADKQAEHEARLSAAARDGLPSNMSITGDTAEIRVEGVLTKRPSLWALFFGGGNTAYTDIIGALSLASNDSRISQVVFSIDSPGGNVDGLFDAIGSIQGFGKPMSVRASNAQSAAFAIAAAAGKIEANGPASTFGSIGVAVDYTFFADMELVSLTNTDSPDKRPDPRTPEGAAVIVRHLNAINELFVDAIATGRKVPAATVKSNYGRGATLLAAEAQRLGMIDTIAGAKPALRVVRSSAAAEGGGQKTETKMDLKTLQAQHPDVFEAAAQLGTERERDRVNAHLTLGEQAGEEGLKVALEAIRKGDAMTQTYMARYMACGMNRRDRNERQTESDGAGAAADNANTEQPAAQDMGDKVAAILAAKRGKKVVANG